MVWPYWPFSEALEHEPAYAIVVAPSVRIAKAAATVGIQNKVFMVFLLEDYFSWALKASVVPFEGQIAASRQAWQWSEADDSLTSSCLRKPLKQIEMSRRRDCL